MLIKNKVKILLHFFVQIFFIHSCFNFAFPLAPQPSYNKPPLSSLEDTPTSSPDQKLPIQNNSDIKNNKQKRYKLLAIIKYTPLAFAILTSIFAILFFLDVFSLENPLEKALTQSFLAISFAINTIAFALILCFFYKISHIDSSSKKDFKRELYLAAALVIITVAIFLIYLLLELMPNLEKTTIPVPFVAACSIFITFCALLLIIFSNKKNTHLENDKDSLEAKSSVLYNVTFYNPSQTKYNDPSRIEDHLYLNSTRQEPFNPIENFSTKIDLKDQHSITRKPLPPLPLQNPQDPQATDFEDLSKLSLITLNPLPPPLQITQNPSFESHLKPAKSDNQQSLSILTESEFSNNGLRTLTDHKTSAGSPPLQSTSEQIQSTADPDTADPDTADPDTADPDTADPDTADPDTADPDTADPDTADPDTADPDNDNVSFSRNLNPSKTYLDIYAKLDTPEKFNPKFNLLEKSNSCKNNTTLANFLKSLIKKYEPKMPRTFTSIKPYAFTNISPLLNLFEEALTNQKTFRQLEKKRKNLNSLDEKNTIEYLLQIIVFATLFESHDHWKDSNQYLQEIQFMGALLTVLEEMSNRHPMIIKKLKDALLLKMQFKPLNLKYHNLFTKDFPCILFFHKDFLQEKSKLTPNPSSSIPTLKSLEDIDLAVMNYLKRSS